MAIEVFLEALRTARGDDPERTRRLLELAARLYGEQNGARIVHALLIDLFPVTPLGPGTVRSLFAAPRPELENAMFTAARIAQPHQTLVSPAPRRGVKFSEKPTASFRKAARRPNTARGNWIGGFRIPPAKSRKPPVRLRKPPGKSSNSDLVGWDEA